MNARRITSLILCLSEAAAALAGEEPVVIEPGSLKMTVEVKATVHSFAAKVTAGSLSLRVDPDTFEVTDAIYRFEWSGVKTGNDKRDREMLIWAEAEKHPEGVFSLKSIQQRGDEVVAGGTLEFHGVSRGIEIPVNIDRTQSGIRVSGSARIDHREWGLQQVRKFLILTVDPTVTVKFEFKTRALPRYEPRSHTRTVAPFSRPDATAVLLRVQTPGTPLALASVVVNAVTPEP